MIEWLNHNFPIGKNYLVCQNDKEQINSFLMEQLVAPFQSGRKHNLWGELAKKLPEIGKKLGWVPNKIPAIFLNETVEKEIADALSTANNHLQLQNEHLEKTRRLLDKFGFLNLAQQNPLFLSEGETKILWLLTQWVKQPIYLIIGYLPAGLSQQRIKDILNFFDEEGKKSKNLPIIILGYKAEEIDWCSKLFAKNNWQNITACPTEPL